MRLYASGPMTGLPDSNFPAFNRAADLLRDAGYEVENPATKGEIEGWTWADYLRYDLVKMLGECQGVATLPGFSLSEGALLETDVASRVKIPVQTVEEWIALAPALIHLPSEGAPAMTGSSEAVDHPAHYGGADNPHETIKCLQAWGLHANAYLWNSVKYISRAGKKDAVLQELKKARFYLDFEIKRLEGESQ